MMKFLCRILLTELLLVMALPHAQAAEKFDWMPPQADEQGMNTQDLGGEQIIPEITITQTPKPTADISKFTKKYVLELKKFNISNDGTNPVETSKGINAALQHAKTLDANYIMFPKGTYLISENDPVMIDHKNTIIDLNGATLQMNPNGLKIYCILGVVNGAENVRVTNGTLRGDKDQHDHTLEGVHAWGHCMILFGGNNIEVDHLVLANGTGDGISTRLFGTRTKEELLTYIVHSIYPKDIEQGAFNDKGVKVNSTEKTRTIEACDITKCNGEFEFGYSTHVWGFPFIRSRVYQVYFYDSDMKFIEMKKTLQYRKVTIPKGATFAHLEFNQPEVSEEPAHVAAKDGFIGRITNLRFPTDVHFHHNTLTGNRRKGLGLSGGVRWIVEDNLFEDIGSVAPAYGVDYESGWECMQDIVFRNNRFKDNEKGDLVICAGTELLIEDNIFNKNVIIWGRAHNYVVRNNTFTGENVVYMTRTGIAKIYGNTYENCNVSVRFDTKGVADGLYRKPGQNIATPPLTLENETMTNVSKITGTYFNFKNAKLNNVHFVAGKETSMANFEDCQLKDVSLEYEAEGPEMYVKIKDCKGDLKEEGPGLNRKKLMAESTIWLIGDSTVASYPKKRDPLAGWGQLLHEYCKEGVTIENHAVSGTTTRSFRSQKYWEKVIPNVKKGDYLFIQFGHNDHYKEKGEHLVSAEDFKQNLIRYVNEAREKGALPILVTPMCRRIYSEGKITRSFDNYPDMVVEAAKETNTPLIDLYEITYEEFNKLDAEQTKDIFLFLPPDKYPAFPDGKRDGVHFQTNGARKLAGWVVRDAKRQHLEIAKLFKEAAAKTNVTINFDFPGGGVVVKSNEGNTVHILPDQSKNKQDWFYWYFEATANQPGMVTFALSPLTSGTAGIPLGFQGPAVSTDFGKTWQWAGADCVEGETFSYDFTEAGQKVRFANTIPYLQSNLDAFLKENKGNPHLTKSILTKSKKGRDVELLQIGEPGPDKKPVLFTCRHHASETIASYVLEGFMKNAISDTPEGVAFRKNYVLYVVPFVDKDGVEDGDQGKNRAPHDHNRDYGRDNLYPEITAIKKLAAEKKFQFTMDWHCPTIRMDIHQRFYFGGSKSSPAFNVENIAAFAALIKKELPPNSPAGPADIGKTTTPSTGSNRTPAPLSNSAYFAIQPGMIMAATLECPFAPPGKKTDPDSSRLQGAAILRAWMETPFQGEHAESAQNQPVTADDPMVSTASKPTLAWWKMEETDGSLAYDSTENGYNLTPAGGMTIANATTNGKIGKGFAFTGSGVRFEQASLLDDMPAGITIMGWCKPDATFMSGQQTWFSKQSGPSNSNQLWLNFVTDGAITMSGRGGPSGTTFISLSSNVAWEDDAWYHYAFTWDSSGCKIYVDGVQKGNNNTSIMNNGTSMNLTIGSAGGASSPFKGVVDDIRLYDSVLTAAEIAEVCNNSGNYSLTVNNGSGDGKYDEGQVVNIVADLPPTLKDEFDAWTGDTAHVADIYNPTTTVTMPATAGTVTATYKKASGTPFIMTIRTDFPGGNGLINGNAANPVEVGDEVGLAPDLRDSSQDWFYWCVEATANQPGEATFVLPAGKIGYQGPAVSYDKGQTWDWMGTATVSGNQFTHYFTKSHLTVRFAVTLPYLQSNLDAFLTANASNSNLTTSVLTKTNEGRDVELIQIGTPGAGKKPVLMTCRHHACETTASYVLEGFMQEAISNSTDAIAFRNNYVLYVVPFVDKDGVEHGDQGKNRSPHDHNRDYDLGARRLYEEVGAIEALGASKKFQFAMDWHCPTLRLESHQLFYFDGYSSSPSTNKANVNAFRANIDSELPSSAPNGPANYMGNRLNTAICSNYFSQQPGIKMSTTLEVPYAPHNKKMSPAACRTYGADILRAWMEMTFR